MTKHDLKEMRNLGAELGAAKAEVERLREALRPFAVFEAVRSKQGGCTPKSGTVWAVASISEEAEITAEHLQAAVAALSPQAEPTDTYTAVDMATAAAQGFRDGQAAVEQAPAPDEREAPVVVATAILGGLYHGGSGPELGEIDIEVCMPALEALQCETVNSSDDVFLPLMSVAQHERIVAALTRPAQAAPQGKFRMGDLVRKTSGSEWKGRVVGWYSTEQTKEGYAVESSAHRNSVQIYPAKALEAVE